MITAVMVIRLYMHKDIHTYMIVYIHTHIYIYIYICVIYNKVDNEKPLILELKVSCNQSSAK